MLKELKIRNLAIIDNLTVRFGKGLNVLTGETGAGKSIIVDALGLALGDRAQSDLVKSGETEAAVQAYFELDDYVILPDAGIERSEGLVLRRVVSSSGKSRAYINDTMVTLQTLSAAGRALVDVSSQHEHQSLMTPQKQRDLVDSFGKLQAEREKVASLFQEVQRLKERSIGLKENLRERAHRMDLLTFQLQEIDSASLKAGEKETLEEEKKILANLNRLNELADSTYSMLYEAEGSCVERLSRAVSQLRDMASIDGSLAEALTSLESAVPLVQDASTSIGRYRDRHDSEPGRLEEVEDRLELIRRLERKYGEGIEGVLGYRDSAAAEKEGIESADEQLEAVEKELRAGEEELLKAALDLSEKRKKTASKTEGLVTETLGELAFGSASFRIGMTREKADDGSYRINSHGLDDIEFLFTANPGEPSKPLSKIISGGELSRVMLALKSVLANDDNVPVLIFDEVDAGIGGKTAESVGKKLDLLACERQLLCITHLPQIASRGDFHLKIEKKEKKDRVLVTVKELSGRERQDEIARMLSGTITEISLKHAGELLERVK